MKRVTRRQIRAWLIPIRSCFSEMRCGYVDTVQGWPVTRLHEHDDYVRIEYAISGFMALITRICPEINCYPLEKIGKKLAAGVLLTVREIDDALALLHRCEDALVGMPRAALLDAVVTEQIAIEMNAIGEKGSKHYAH